MTCSLSNFTPMPGRDAEETTGRRPELYSTEPAPLTKPSVVPRSHGSRVEKSGSIDLCLKASLKKLGICFRFTFEQKSDERGCEINVSEEARTKRIILL